MELTMVQTADRDGEPVANFPTHCPLLGKLDVVGIGGGASANQARLGGHKPEVFAIALAYWFADNSNLLRTALALLRLFMPVRLVLWSGRRH
jgi:hypothetical protein